MDVTIEDRGQPSNNLDFATQTLASLFNKTKQHHANVCTVAKVEFDKIKETASILKNEIAEYEDESLKYDDFSPLQRSALDSLNVEIKKLNIEAEEQRGKVEEKLEENTHLPNENSNKEYFEKVKARETVVNEKSDKIQKSIKPFEEYLGLKVERFDEADYSHLRFVFTCIDESLIDRPFSFSLKVDDDLYVVFDLSPEVDDLDSLVEDLNKTNHLKEFFCNIRKSFMKSIVTERNEGEENK